MRALEKEVKDLKAETDRLNTESGKAIALGKTDGALKDAKAEEARLRKSLKEKDAEMGQLKKTRDAIPVHLQAVFSSPPSAEPPKLASNAVKELARGTPKKTVGPPQRRKGPKPQVEGFDAILADIETAFKRFDVDGNGRIGAQKVTCRRRRRLEHRLRARRHEAIRRRRRPNARARRVRGARQVLHKKKLAEDAKKEARRRRARGALSARPAAAAASPAARRPRTGNRHRRPCSPHRRPPVRGQSTH